MQNKTRKINGRHYMMVQTKKFTSLAEAKDFAANILKMGDFEITKTGPTTWRIYKPLEAKSDEQDAQTSVAASKSKRSSRKKSQRAPRQSVVQKTITPPPDFSVVVTELQALRNDFVKELRANTEILKAVLASAAAPAALPSAATILTPESETETKPIIEAVSEEPAPEVSRETVVEEPVEAEEDAATLQSMARIQKIIVKKLKTMLDKNDPEASYATIGEIALAVSRRPAAVEEGLDVLIGNGCVTLEGVGSDAKVRLTEQGWNAKI